VIVLKEAGATLQIEKKYLTMPCEFSMDEYEAAMIIGGMNGFWQ
jgi:hypothetical protein